MSFLFPRPHNAVFIANSFWKTNRIGAIADETVVPCIVKFVSRLFNCTEVEPDFDILG